MKTPSFFTAPRFSRQAEPMRHHFEKCFGEERSSRPERFVWDFWHVKGQYRQLRTPAYHFFPKELYAPFHAGLVEWGRRNLGCHDISPPWLSCYTDGCYQELHGDLPHGPWAFVFSLTPWDKRAFRGGQTILLKEPILDLWRNLDFPNGMEQSDIFSEIAPKFNQLTVFDPRIPHGVKRVEGAEGVLDGRLVIHGWFVQPRPFVDGPLTRREFHAFVEHLSEELSQFLNASLLLHNDWIRGLLTIRVSVTPEGRGGKFAALPSTARSSVAGLPRKALLMMESLALNYRFPRKKLPSTLTLPIVLG